MLGGCPPPQHPGPACDNKLFTRYSVQRPWESQLSPTWSRSLGPTNVVFLARGPWLEHCDVSACRRLSAANLEGDRGLEGAIQHVPLGGTGPKSSPSSSLGSALLPSIPESLIHSLFPATFRAPEDTTITASTGDLLRPVAPLLFEAAAHILLGSGRPLPRGFSPCGSAGESHWVIAPVAPAGGGGG